MENVKGRFSASPIVPTSELVYIFCAAAWVGGVLENNQDPISLSFLIFLFSSFCMIPVEFHTGILWQKVASIFDSDSGSGVRNTKHESQLAMVDILRIFCLTMMFIYMTIPFETKNDTSIDEKRNYLLFISTFLILSNAWNNIAFFGSIISFYKKDNDYKTLFNKYYEMTSVLIDGTDFKKMLYKIAVKTFEKLNFMAFVFIFPIFGWSIFLIIVSSFINECLGMGFSVPEISNLLLDLTVAFFLCQSILKIIHVVFISSMIIDVEASGAAAPVKP